MSLDFAQHAMEDLTNLGSKRKLEDVVPASQSSIDSDLSADANVVTKRKDAINWDEYFMSIAFLSSLRSKDPNTQVGACIVNPDKKIVGIGYNGFPKGCSDDELPWSREASSKYDTKYMYGMSNDFLVPFISPFICIHQFVSCTCGSKCHIK